VENLATYFFASYGTVKAVDKISFEVTKGESIGLVGESGSGKSTVALSVIRLVPRPGKIAGGKILFNEQDLVSVSEAEMKNVRGRDIAMSFQDPMTFLNPVMRIEDQIAEVCVRHLGMSKSDAIKRAVDVMASVQIQDPSRVAKSYPHQLSGGMRQRILLAIAISCDPSLLIVDEPTTALDVITQVQIISLLRKLRRDLGLAAIIITHDIGVAVQVCDRLAVMYAGHIVEQADTKVVINNPLHPYTTGLLQSIPKIDTPRGALKYIPGSVPDLVDPPVGCIFNPRCLHAEGACRATRPETVEVEKGHFVACMKFSE